jgi:hypothetical protein
VFVTEAAFKTPTAQRRSWRIQRIAWLVMALLLLVALGGGLGQGPLSRASARSSDGRFEVSYHRVWRVNSPQTLDLRLDAGESGSPSLLLDAGFLARTTLERVTPLPERASLGAAGHRLFFSSTDSGPALIRLELTPRGMGRLRAELSAGNGPPLTLTFIVLP